LKKVIANFITLITPNLSVKIKTKQQMLTSTTTYYTTKKIIFHDGGSMMIVRQLFSKQ